uniref:Uncharacterized protein n=1 Tax=Anguilla anguilla TaxID=7936 RepID=A0A0E9VSL1_ANGAN
MVNPTDMLCFTYFICSSREISHNLSESSPY